MVEARPVSAQDQAKGGARAWKRWRVDAVGKISASAQNRTAMLPVSIGDAGAAACVTELAKTMTAQMGQ